MSVAEKCFNATVFAGLNGSVGAEEAAHVQHAGVEALADEIAGVVDGDAVRRRGVTSHDEDPLETVLRDLCADIRNQRSERGVTDAIRAWVDRVAADFVGSGLTVAFWLSGAQRQLPIRPVPRLARTYSDAASAFPGETWRSRRRNARSFV